VNRAELKAYLEEITTPGWVRGDEPYPASLEDVADIFAEVIAEVDYSGVLASRLIHVLSHQESVPEASEVWDEPLRQPSLEHFE
jgi:hypothetical protein